MNNLKEKIEPMSRSQTSFQEPTQELSQEPERKSLKASIERYKEITRYEKGLVVGIGSIPLGNGAIRFKIEDDHNGTYCTISIKTSDSKGERLYVYADYDQLLVLKKIIDECIKLVREII